MSLRTLIAGALLAALVALGGLAWARADEQGAAPPAPREQTAAEAQRKSAGCMSCHTTTDSLTMHTSPGVILGCSDCHGGNAGVFVPTGAPPGSSGYRQALDAAHVPPRNPAAWHYPSSAKPPRTYTLLNQESPD